MKGRIGIREEVVFRCISKDKKDEHTLGTSLYGFE